MSPFMSGLLIGMSIFSALSMQWAKAELVATRERQAQEARAAAEDLAGAMEFAVLTENDRPGGPDYDDTFALKRARQFSSATGTTLGGNEVLVTTRTEEEAGMFGAPRTQVALTATDDILTRAEVNRTGNTEDLNRAATRNAPVALFDAGGVRARQVVTSNQRMEAMAEQLYAYYAAKMRFPSANEFTSLSGSLGFRDAWGREFAYTVDADGQQGELEFSAPWGVTQKLGLSLQDTTKSGE